MIAAAQILGFIGGALALAGAGCSMLSIVFFGHGLIVLLAGILGLVGGAKVRREAVLGGGLMLAGGVTALLSWSLLVGPLLIIGGIFGIVAGLKQGA